MDVRVGRLCIAEVPEEVYDTVCWLANSLSLRAIDCESPATKYGLELRYCDVLYYIFDGYGKQTISFDMFLEGLKRCIDAGLIMLIYDNAELGRLADLIACISKLLKANVIVEPALSFDRLGDDIYRIAGAFSIGDKQYCIAERSTRGGTTYVLIHPTPNLGKNIDGYYIVPYDGGVCYKGSLNHARKNKILYVARKLNKRVVTSSDMRHFDVRVENGYLLFSDGWAIGDGTSQTAKELFKHCYLPRPLLHRLFVWYLFFRTGSASSYAERWIDNFDGVILTNVSRLSYTTAALGHVKATFGEVEWRDFMPLKIRVNGTPIYTCDLKDVLLTAGSFTSQSEFDNFLQNVSETPLFLRKFLAGYSLKVSTYIDDKSSKTCVVELRVQQHNDGTYSIEGVRCTRDDLAYIGCMLCQHIYYHDTDILQAQNLQQIQSPWLEELGKVIGDKTLQAYLVAKQKAKTLLHDLLIKYKGLLSLTQIGGKEGVLVKGRKHTYFVELNTGCVWLVRDNNILVKHICIDERVPEHADFTTYDRIISRIVALMNDDVVSRYIGTLPR